MFTIPRSTRVLRFVLAALLTACSSDDPPAAGLDPSGSSAGSQTTTASTSPRTTSARSPSSTAAEDHGTRATEPETPASPTAAEMLSTAQDFFDTMGRRDFPAAGRLFVENWTFESFGGGTLTAGDGDDLVDVLGFNGTILSFAPGACVVDSTSRAPTVRCPDTRVHGPLPAALGIDQSFPLPLELVFARDGRLVGVLPDRAALERHPDASATVAASSRVGVDLTGWIAESADGATLLRPPGRAIVPTIANADRLVELARSFHEGSG